MRPNAPIPRWTRPPPYGLALHHKHLPEMAAITGLTTPPTFVPVVADYYAGMETMIPLDLPALGLTAQQVADALADYYAGKKDDLGPSAERGYRRRLPGCQ